MLLEYLGHFKLMLSYRDAAGLEGVAEYRLGALKHDLFQLFQHDINLGTGGAGRSPFDNNYVHRVHKAERMVSV